MELLLQFIPNQNKNNEILCDCYKEGGFTDYVNEHHGMRKIVFVGYIVEIWPQGFLVDSVFLSIPNSFRISTIKPYKFIYYLNCSLEMESISIFMK